MKTKTDARTLSLSQVFQLTRKNPDAVFMTAQTSESLEAIRTRCESHWSRIGLLHSWNFAFSVGLAVYLVFFGFIVSHGEIKGRDWLPLLMPAPLVIILATAIGLAIVKSSVFGCTRIGYPEQISEALKPLKSEPYICRDMVELLSKSAAGRAYRDAVVANGRELVMADASVLYQLRYAEQQEVTAAEEKYNCQRVHGLISA